MSGLRTRIITAIFFVLSMIAGIFSHPMSLGLLFVLLPVLCLWEFFALTLPPGVDGNTLFAKLLSVIFGVIPPALVFWHIEIFSFPTDMYLLWGGIVVLALSAFLVWELYRGDSQPFTRVAFVLLGLVYIGIPFSMLIDLGIGGESGFRPFLVFGIILLIWANDTFAYLMGSWLGKTPLFPRVSPKKTWEGTLFGAAITLIASWLYWLLFRQIDLVYWLLIGVLIGSLGTVGDLIESMLKRSFRTKDSGGLLPGHGGFLDRFDSLIFVIPFIWVLLKVSGIS